MASYLPPKEFYDELKKSQELGKPTEQLVVYFYLLFDKIQGSYQYWIYDEENCRQNTILNLIEKVPKFDLVNRDSGAIFSYATTMVINGLKQQYKKEKHDYEKVQRIKKILTEDKSQSRDQRRNKKRNQY